MQPISEMLETLRKRNVMLWLSDDQLKCRAPQGALTASDLDELRFRQPEIVKFLSHSLGDRIAMPPFVTRPANSPPRPSFMQERLWRVTRQGWFNANMEIFVARVTGPFNSEAMKRALEELERRHEILRTRFAGDEHSCELILDPPGHVVINTSTLSVSEHDRERVLSAHVRELLERPVDITRNKPLQAHLIELDANQDDRAWVVTVHHIVGDCLSCALLRDELVQLYQQFSSGLPIAGETNPVQYSDFGEWQRGWLNGRIEAVGAYWRDQLSSVPALPLPIKAMLDPDEMVDIGTCSFELPASLVKRLDETATRTHVNRYVLLITGFHIALALWTGEPHLVIGCMGSDRVVNQVDRVVGPFLARDYIRADLSGDPSFEEASQRVLDAYIRAISNPWVMSSTKQDLPLTSAVKLDVNYIPFRRSMAQAITEVKRSDSGELTITGIPLPEPKHTRQRRFIYAKLGLGFVETETGSITGHLNFEDGAFEQEVLDKLVHQITEVFKIALEDPSRPLSALKA